MSDNWEGGGDEAVEGDSPFLDIWNLSDYLKKKIPGDFEKKIVYTLHYTYTGI